MALGYFASVTWSKKRKIFFPLLLVSFGTGKQTTMLFEALYDKQTKVNFLC